MTNKEKLEKLKNELLNYEGITYDDLPMADGIDRESLDWLIARIEKLEAALKKIEELCHDSDVDEYTGPLSDPIQQIAREVLDDKIRKND